MPEPRSVDERPADPSAPGADCDPPPRAVLASPAVPLFALAALGLLGSEGARLAGSSTAVALLGPVSGPLLGLAGALFLAALCSSLSAALLRVLPTSFDGNAVDTGTRADLRRHLGESLERTERLAAHASVAAFVLRAGAIALVHELVGRLLGAGPDGTRADAPGPVVHVLTTALAGGALVHVTTQSIPLAIAQAHAERLLPRVLPVVAPALLPFGWISDALRWLRLPFLRLVSTPDASHETRRLVEGFRVLVEEAELEGDLGQSTQELIANVIEFTGADAAEVMTPRTEIRAIAEDEPLEAAIAAFAQSGYSRIPVYRETIDTVVGTLTALEAARAVAEGRLATTRIQAVMRPPLLVPETKLVPELLADFRRERQKMAIVIDEYGGTAGLVTLADVMAEVLGEVEDEYAQRDERITGLECGGASVDAGLHVSEVNEELGLELPEEEDFETLAGFVLSELGRIPAQGEAFDRDGVAYEILDASDRRIVRVAVRRPSGPRLPARPSAPGTRSTTGKGQRDGSRSETRDEGPDGRTVGRAG
ncbi:MAG: hemolysin family protein [Planctomycetota bacterium]